MSFPARPRNAWAIFRNRDFSCLMASRFFSVLSLTMVTLAVGWQVYDATRRPLDLGLVGLAQFLPVLLLMPVTGAVADRLDRRKILITCYMLGTVVSLAPLFLVPGALTEAWPIVATLASLAPYGLSVCLRRNPCCRTWCPVWIWGRRWPGPRRSTNSR